MQINQITAEEFMKQLEAEVLQMDEATALLKKEIPEATHTNAQNMYLLGRIVNLSNAVKQLINKITELEEK